MFDHRALLALLHHAHTTATTAGPETTAATLTVHLAERDGCLVAAAVLERTTVQVGPEWTVAA